MMDELDHGLWWVLLDEAMKYSIKDEEIRVDFDERVTDRINELVQFARCVKMLAVPS